MSVGRIVTGTPLQFLTEGVADIQLVSCQPRVTVTSCFVYKVIMDLESIYHFCFILSIRVSKSGVYRLMLEQKSISLSLLVGTTVPTGLRRSLRNLSPMLLNFYQPHLS